MFRSTPWLILLVACSYDPPRPGPGDGDDPAGPDAPPLVPPSASCTAHADPVLCLEFEEQNDDVFFDGSTNKFDAEGDNLVEMSREMSPAILDHKAAGFGPTSQLTIAQDLALSGSVTVEMWLQRVPTITARQVLFDSAAGRFVVSYGNSDRQIRCAVNVTGIDNDDLRVDSARTIDDGNWHHVACAFDAADRQMKVYLDGNVVGCKQLDEVILPQAGTTRIGAPQVGTQIDHLVGALDGIHVYKRALTSTEVCSSASRTGCSTSCPANQGQGSPGGS